MNDADIRCLRSHVQSNFGGIIRTKAYEKKSYVLLLTGILTTVLRRSSRKMEEGINKLLSYPNGGKTLRKCVADLLYIFIA
jgi:hypothetical protein